MSKLDSYKDVISRNIQKKTKGITAYKIPVNGGCTYYGTVIPDTSPAIPDASPVTTG